MRFFDVENSLDYYSFGMLMPERNGGANYRYGYQGSEKDNEVKGEGNSYTTHFRQLDPRLGRWLTIDPKASSLPWQSPYCSMDNNPVWHNDPLGDFIKALFSKKAKKNEKFDDKGVPVKVQQEFQGEYGINVKMVDGNLVFDSNVEGYEERLKNGEISKTARKMWLKALDPNKDSKQTFVFDSFTTEEGSTFGLGGEQWVGPFFTSGKTSYFNLKGVYDNGTLSILDYSAYPTTGNNGKVLRSFAFARVLEHEFLHGKKPYKYSFSHPLSGTSDNQLKSDALIRKMNKIRVEIGLTKAQRIVHRLPNSGTDSDAETILGIPGDSSTFVRFKYNLPIK